MNYVKGITSSLQRILDEFMYTSMGLTKYYELLL